jgi:hypothetical protein
VQWPDSPEGGVGDTKIQLGINQLKGYNQTDCHTDNPKNDGGQGKIPDDPVVVGKFLDFSCGSVAHIQTIRKNAKALMCHWRFRFFRAIENPHAWSAGIFELAGAERPEKCGQKRTAYHKADSDEKK